MRAANITLGAIVGVALATLTCGIIHLIAQWYLS
jgi:hypothetical protein